MDLGKPLLGKVRDVMWNATIYNVGAQINSVVENKAHDEVDIPLVDIVNSQVFWQLLEDLSHE